MSCYAIDDMKGILTASTRDRFNFVMVCEQVLRGMYLVRGGCESMRCILLNNLKDGGVISDRKNDDNVERMSS
jgi:hypothetical protein